MNKLAMGTVLGFARQAQTGLSVRHTNKFNKLPQLKNKLFISPTQMH